MFKEIKELYKDAKNILEKDPAANSIYEVIKDDNGNAVEALYVYKFTPSDVHSENHSFIILTTDWQKIHFNISKQKITENQGKINKIEIISETSIRFISEHEEDLAERGLDPEYFDLDTFYKGPILSEE